MYSEESVCNDMDGGMCGQPFGLSDSTRTESCAQDRTLCDQHDVAMLDTRRIETDLNPLTYYSLKLCIESPLHTSQRGFSAWVHIAGACIRRGAMHVLDRARHSWPSLFFGRLGPIYC